MKFNLIIAGIALAIGAMTAAAQSSDDSRLQAKMNEAVMKVYDEYLQKNPDDYETRFSRAYQHYYFGNYINALADVNQALDETPQSKADLRFDELMLRARVYDARGEYQNEIADLKQALALKPSHDVASDMLARVSLRVGELDQAEENYRTLLRLEPTNYVAMHGLAKIEAKKGNYERAAELVDEAARLYPTEQAVYMNRADVLMDMDQVEPAIQNYIQALAVGENIMPPLRELVVLSDTRYNDVMAKLAENIERAPRVGMLYYVRAMIAIEHLHYGQAVKNLKAIVDYNLYDYHTVYYNLALCQANLLQWDDALENINRAITMHSSDADYYVLKARIERYRGRGDNFDAANNALMDAATVNAEYGPMLLAKAHMLIAQRKDAEAISYLNTAVKQDDVKAEALLTRGWVLKYRLKNTDAAKADFQSVLATGESDMESLRGFALHEMSRADEARAWAEQIIADEPAIGGEAYYYAAALLSDMDDNDKAMQYLEKALENGYGSLFEVRVNENPYINLKLVRRHDGFNALVEKYQTCFQERR